MEIIIGIYVTGGFLASGMIIGEMISSVVTEIVSAFGVTDKIKTICYQVFQVAIWSLIAFLFSWVSVGFLYSLNHEKS